MPADAQTISRAYVAAQTDTRPRSGRLHAPRGTWRGHAIAATIGALVCVLVLILEHFR